MADDRRHRADPSVHQLRLFVVPAEELHFGNAARRVFLTQPALSQQIKMLERRLGTRLVECGTHSVELTSIGQELLPAAKPVIESITADAEPLHRIPGRTAAGQRSAPHGRRADHPRSARRPHVRRHGAARQP